MALRYSHTTHRGVIQNAAISMDKASFWFATADSRVAAVGEFDPAQVDAPEGVSIQLLWADHPEHREITLPSGGTLIIN